MRIIKQSEFKIYCNEIKKLLPIIGYSHFNVVYTFKLLDNALAQVSYDLGARTAIFSLTTKIDDDEIATTFDSKSLARHECAHLLISHLYELSKLRYTTENDIDNAEEELVKKIENLLNIYAKNMNI